MNVHMDAAEWIKSMVQEEACMDSTSLSGELLCARPPQAMERRLRPQHEHPLKCPRCDSTHTKFCYYNNYSLSQPRYFCKTCRRYWTKGGSLRNVPVGGGCRKNKRSGGKKPAMEIPHMAAPPLPLNSFPTFPSLQLPLFSSNPSHGLSLMDIMIENQSAGVAHGTHFSGSSSYGDFGHGLFSNGNSMGFSVEGSHGGNFMGQEKMLALEWQQDQGCADGGRDGVGYPTGLSFWAGMMNGHGSSASNHLV